MANLKKKLFALAFLAVVLAVFFPMLKKKYQKHIKPRLDLASGIYIGAKNFRVFGIPIPWRYVLPGVALFLVVQLWRRRRRLKKLEKERLQKEQTVMSTASVPEPVCTTNVIEAAPAEPVKSSQVPPTDPNDLKLMENRVRTFSLWPTTSSANVFELARAGFSFTGPDDIVRCFKCDGTLKEWTPKDSPIESHKEFYPDCPFVVDLANNNTIFDTLFRLKDLSVVCDMVAERLKKLCTVEGKRVNKDPASEQLSELQKRLDTTERTMHLVMKQMEAVTKCLAKSLADDPALSGDKSLSEITEGLLNIKESNV